MPAISTNPFPLSSGNHNPKNRIKNGKTVNGKGPPGRKKGVPNKLTRSLKWAFEESFFNDPKKHPVDWLIWLKNKHPVAYAGLFARMLPLKLGGDGADKIAIAAAALLESNIARLQARSVVEVEADMKTIEHVEVLTEEKAEGAP